MNISKLRTIMQRYQSVGVLYAGAYLGAHYLWTKRRSLLFLLSFTLLGLTLPFLRLREAAPSQRQPAPLAPPRVQDMASKSTRRVMVSAVPDYERGNQKLPYYAQWGSYTVVVEQNGNDETGAPQRVRILEPGNKVLREIRAWAIGDVNIAKMTGNSPEELHISLWSGGAYASFAEVYFSQKGRLHNILTFNKEDQEKWEVVDLNHDGIPEIVAENPVLGDFSAYNFHRHWPVITILGWNGSRYVNVTSHYPARSLKEATERRKDILEDLQTPKKERKEWDFQDKIMAYYANMLSIGQGDVAKRWLKRHLDASDWTWVKANDAELRQIIATALERRGHVIQDKVIDQSDFSVKQGSRLDDKD